MAIRWTGQVTSRTRLDKQTGKPAIYTLTIYEDGLASCSCPAYAIGRNNRRLDEAMKRAFRCKHLEEAFLVLGENKAKVTVKDAKAKPPRASRRVKSATPNGLGLDDDEFAPIARRD